MSGYPGGYPGQQGGWGASNSPRPDNSFYYNQQEQQRYAPQDALQDALQYTPQYAPPLGPPPPLSHLEQYHHQSGPSYAPQSGPPYGPPYDLPHAEQPQYLPPPGPPPPPSHFEQYHHQSGPSFDPPHGSPYAQQPQYLPPSGPPPPPSHFEQYSAPSEPPPDMRAPPPLSVPSGSQEFGHGAPHGYTFRYSNCSGRRKALLIGINYKGQSNELKGCINDAYKLSSFLERHEYKRCDMVILTDDENDPGRVPTKANILREMQRLVRDARADDALFLHYSGHGGQTKDSQGDETDGYNEVIYPVDFKNAGHIEDDLIHEVVVRPLLAGVRLTAIFDSCHSATVMDLPYIYSTKGVLKESNLAAEAGKGLLGAAMAYARGDYGGLTSGLVKLTKSAIRGDDAFKMTKQTRTSPADVVMWSGSKDDQTSADATIDLKATGAMSWAFTTALEVNPQQSYVDLLNSIRDLLEPRYSQKPQLSCSHPLDTNLLFVI